MAIQTVRELDPYRKHVTMLEAFWALFASPSLCEVIGFGESYACWSGLSDGCEAYQERTIKHARRHTEAPTKSVLRPGRCPWPMTTATR